MLNIFCLMLMVIHVTENSGFNVALNKPTIMSSIYGDYYASYAVDGNKETDVHKRKCTHTHPLDRTPWLMVDLQGMFLINSVILTNRGDAYPQRLHTFAIEIFEKNPLHFSSATAILCLNYTGDPIGEGETRTFTCQMEISGRFVRIRKWKLNKLGDVLTLCEFQVISDSQIGCGTSTNFRRTNGIRLMHSQLEQITDVITPIRCAEKCHNETGCLAFNFNVNSRECELILNPTFKDVSRKDIQQDWCFFGSDLFSNNK